MTETGNRTSRKNGNPRQAPAAQRDAYDDFLDMAAAKPASMGTGRKASSSKKTGTSSQKRKKSAAVEVQPGIGMPGFGESQSKRRTVSASASAGKKRSAATVSSPVGMRASSRVAASGAKAATGTGAKSAAGKRTSAGSASSGRGAAGTAARRTGPGRENPLARRQAVLAVDNRDERDAYDDFLRECDEPKRKSSGRKRRGFSGATAALIIGIFCVVGLGVWQTAQYRSFLTMKRAVEQQSFYEGTTVEGVDVSGMTLDEATEYWETKVEPAHSQRTVTLSNGASFTAAELGYTSDYATVLSNAWSAGRSGSLEERYAMLSSRRDTPVSYAVTRRAYSEEAIAQCVSAIAEAIDRPAESAKIDSFDLNNYTFTFTDEVTGSQLDADALRRDMAQALENGGGEVELVVKAIQPKTTKAKIASQYGLIASAVTNASSSSSNRLSNIKLSLQLIHGTCLKPGETFSFNATVGKRTTERGFKLATAYSSGEVTEDVGGGICQVSTTLFNAAVKSDLEIVERHNHSLTVSYVDRGKDAAVNWDSQDLRFTNTTGDNIYICCALTDDKRVRIGIFGKLLANGESIAVEGQVTETVAYETIYQPNLALASGEAKVTQNGKDGCKAVAYKIRLDANGNEISRELLCRSTYKAIAEVVEYGP